MTQRRRRRSSLTDVRARAAGDSPRRTLRIDGLAFGGEAVGRDPSGRVVFVHGAAPGDLVEVALVEEKRSFARGEIMTLVEAGPSRVTPPCPIAARCGGCPWQHVTIAAQLAAKQDIVRRALGKTGVEPKPIVPSPVELGYRTRARLRVHKDGAVTMGFSMRRSHTLVDVTACPALDARLDEALQRARRALAALADGAEALVEGLVAADGRTHLAFELPEPAPSLESEAASLLGPLTGGAIVGVVLRWPRHHRVFGEAELEVESGFFGSAAGFAQANTRQNEVLRRTVLERLFAGETGDFRVLELFAGDGNFSRDLVTRSRLVAVEGESRAAGRLLANLRRAAPRTATEAPRWSVRTEAAETAVARLVGAGERFDLVLLDPPRAGAEALMAQLPSLAPRRIVYVSCDPMTLQRDISLIGPRYTVEEIQPIEMMPHTSHIETVVSLVATPA
jgi:23S rRNA (uracil1939-C5)-methyltransferase